MKRGWLVLVVALFAAISVVDADMHSKLFEDTQAKEKKPERKFSSLAALNSRTYRSAGNFHKMIVSADDPAALARMQQAGAREISDYRDCYWYK